MASSMAVRVCLRRSAAGRLEVRVLVQCAAVARAMAARRPPAEPSRSCAPRMRCAPVASGAAEAPHSAGELPKPLENQRVSRLTCSCKNNWHLRAETVRIVRVQTSKFTVVDEATSPRHLPTQTDSLPRPLRPRDSLFVHYVQGTRCSSTTSKGLVASSTTTDPKN